VAEDEPTDGTIRVPPAVRNRDRLNLGWLLLTREAEEFSLEGRLKGVSEEILRRAMLVSTSLFSHIVNDNLEVRTSVSIDPSTGAATGKALYTYEALPRSTVLAFEVVVSNPRYYRINGQEPLGGDMGKVKQTVASGLDFCEALGIGGMNTRGMGRMKVTAGGGL
jgi:CRISPR-associated protein Cmr4